MQHPPRSIRKRPPKHRPPTPRPPTPRAPTPRAPMRPGAAPRHPTKTAQPEPTSPHRPRCVVAIPIPGGSCGRDRSLRSPRKQRPMTPLHRIIRWLLPTTRKTPGSFFPRTSPRKSNRRNQPRRLRPPSEQSRWVKAVVSDHSMARHVHAAVFATKPRLTSAPDADLILPSLLERPRRHSRPPRRATQPSAHLSAQTGRSSVSSLC